MDKPAPIDDLPSTATLMNDTAFAQMFEGPSHELRALKFDKYDFERTPGRLTGFCIVDRGVEGLNHFSGDSVDGGNAEFWVTLNEGCDEGYYVVKGTTASEPNVLFKGRLEQKGDSNRDGDQPRRHFASLRGDFSVYLCNCHLMAAPSVDSAWAACLVDAYRGEVAPLAIEYRRVMGSEPGQRKKYQKNRLAILDGLYAKIQRANNRFKQDAAPIGLDYKYYIALYSRLLASGPSPSEQAARQARAMAAAKAERRHKNAQTTGDILLSAFLWLLKGCFWVVAIGFCVIVGFGLLLMVLFI